MFFFLIPFIIFRYFFFQSRSEFESSFFEPCFAVKDVPVEPVEVKRFPLVPHLFGQSEDAWEKASVYHSFRDSVVGPYKGGETMRVKVRSV